MAFFKLKVEGFNRVRNALRGTAVKLPKTTENAIYPWAQRTRATLRSTKYPPKRPKQRYVRTGRLGRSWSATRIRGGATIKNSATYASYVVGNMRGDGQAWMHVGRWWKARPIIDEAAKELPPLIADAIQKELDKAA